MDMGKGDLLELRLQGLTYQAIAERAGVSRQRIQQLLEPPKAVRSAVVAAAGGLCQECGVGIGESGHVHHKGTTASNGDDYNDYANLVLLCVSCHILAHRRNPNNPLSTCQHCGHIWPAELEHPKKCPSSLCQLPYPLGRPPQ